MSSFASLTSKELIKILESKGFLLKRIHVKPLLLRTSPTDKITVVPTHNKDLAKGTLYAILKQAGIEKGDI